MTAGAKRPREHPPPLSPGEGQCQAKDKSLVQQRARTGSGAPGRKISRSVTRQTGRVWPPGAAGHACAESAAGGADGFPEPRERS